MDLATGDEVCAYYEAVMRDRFLPSGRVRYFPMSDYLGDGRFRSIPSGAETTVTVRRKHVDATLYTASVPATHTPNFAIAPEVWFEPLNALPKLRRTPAGYVVVGGGKTGIDAVLWLLQNGVDPDAIRWIAPRDGWLLDRANTQPGLEYFEQSIGAEAAKLEAMAASTELEELFDRLEAAGYLTRIDRSVRPTMFHAATVSQLELEQLRRVKNVIRLGRVSAIEADRIILRDGEIPTGRDQLHVDCSARPLERAEPRPVFEPERITPQMVRPYQPVFSASLTAW
ncbi:MAG: NAD(P)/FAD-dependent oxidoreductase, partial [Pseudomonadota bacterium]